MLSILKCTVLFKNQSNNTNTVIAKYTSTLTLMIVKLVKSCGTGRIYGDLKIIESQSWM